jgi:hypothetical protein
MKAILEFDLPEETDSYEHAMSGARYAIVIENICEHLRELRKYENKTSIKIVDLEKFINEQVQEYNINLY